MASALPPSSDLPFDLPSSAGGVRALLFHGFTGSPYEVLPLGIHLQGRGLSVTGPVLPGHGSSPARLAQVGAEDWMAVATRALMDVTRSGDPVVVGGLSMGGLVSICLAAAHPERVATLILMAPALRLRPEGQLAIAAARRGVAALFPVIPKGIPGGDCGDPVGRQLNPSYSVVPTGGLPALGDMQLAARSALACIRSPTLIVHGAGDMTVPVGGSRRLPRKLPRARSVELRVLDRTRHLIPLDVERDTLFELVDGFLRQEGLLH